MHHQVRPGGWHPPFNGHYHCGLIIHFDVANLQPIYPLLLKRKDVNLVVRLLFYADGIATLSELGAGRNIDTRDCLSHEVIDLAIPMYINSGNIRLSTFCPNMPRPGEPCLKRLDYRFVEV